MYSYYYLIHRLQLLSEAPHAVGAFELMYMCSNGLLLVSGTLDCSMDSAERPPVPFLVKFAGAASGSMHTGCLQSALRDTLTSLYSVCTRGTGE